ncbi:MAG: DUF87 domain-containing protein, partial [Oscillospiraceae bacterium]|nr:DUF87 domain-containing protein [Oscillospiraceae bacterium]
MAERYRGFGFPQDTAAAVEWTSIIRQDGPLPVSERTSSRMVKIAANLPSDEWIGWQAYIPIEGSVGFSSFGTKTVKQSDLMWIVEETADARPLEPMENETLASGPHISYTSWRLHEIMLPVAEKSETGTSIGFGDDFSKIKESSKQQLNYYRWPQTFGDQFGELIEALRIEGAAIRYVVGSAKIEEQKVCIKQVEMTWLQGGNEISSYVGYPVRTRLLLATPTVPTARIRAIVGVCVPGAELRQIGELGEKAVLFEWNNPLLSPRILPDYAARIMAFEPTLGQEPLIGVESRDPEAKLRPARHKECAKGDSIQIGKAMDISGVERIISVGDEDLRRHWQIIGQTGTGKSTLLASSVLEAIKKGCGITFFDPHGTTIEFILRILPKEYADRVRIVHIGDADNPVPINMWETDDPTKAERSISDMCLLFQEIFDPKREGFVGPRWERMFSLLAKTSIAIFGRRASFEAIVTIAREKFYVKSAATILKEKHPGLADSLTAEWVNNKSNEFTDVVAWFLSKFQRLTSVEQLRNTLGAGANALDFDITIDKDTITLIDLALPTIGTHAARVIGTLLLLQLWSGALVRKKREKTHIVIIDEAHLFQTNPLPQMLAEGRKFGISLIMAHQHNGQLTYDVREALSANSANFSAFCLSTRDAAEVRDRFDDPAIQRDLSRQNVFNAITTISVDGKQTPAFTLQVLRPNEQPNGEEIASYIEGKSLRSLVEPYRGDRPLSDKEIVSTLRAQ